MAPALSFALKFCMPLFQKGLGMGTALARGNRPRRRKVVFR